MNSSIQLVEFPTREDNSLDIILVDDTNLVGNIHSKTPLGNSDHLMVMFDMYLTIMYVNDPDNLNNDNSFNYDFYVDCDDGIDFNIFNFTKADWSSIIIYLFLIVWHVFLYCFSIDSYCHAFGAILYGAFEKFVPLRKSRFDRNCKTKRAGWKICKNCRKAYRRKLKD